MRTAKVQLTAALDAALEEGLRAAEAQDTARFTRVAEALRDTYEWGRDTTLGVSGQPARDEMLTFAMPSFEAIVRFYVLGAMAAKLRWLPVCRALATAYPVDTVDGSEPMATHPLWGEYQRGAWEADLAVHFLRALDVVRGRGEFAVPPPRGAGDVLCEFDFLVEVHLQVLNPDPRTNRHCPNYAHFPSEAAKRVCADLVDRRDEPGVLPSESAGNLAVALVAADMAGLLLRPTPRREWYPSPEWPPVVRQHLLDTGADRLYQPAS